MTNELKSTVIGFFVQNKKPEWIAKKLDLDIKQVNAVVAKFAQSFAPVLSASDSEIDGNLNDDYNAVPESFIKEARRQLLESGMPERDVSRVIDRALRYAERNNKTYSDVNKFYADCIKNMKTNDFFIKKSGSGNDGVAIMTGGVSDRIDKGMKRGVRNNQDHIFKPKG